MAAYGAAVSLLNTLVMKAIEFPADELLQNFGNAVYTLKLFLEENREVKRDFEIQIREAIYEAQDIIASVRSFKTQFLSPSEAEIRIESLSIDFCRVERKLLSMVEMTTEEFNHQTLDRKISNSVWKPSDEIPSALDYPLVGRNVNLIQLENRLMRGSAGLEVIPIVGIPGIGKTALAYFLLDNPLNRRHFDATGVVKISVKYDKRNTLLDLLGSLNQMAGGAFVHQLVKYRYRWSDAILQKTNDQLVKHLYDYLKHKKYLILLDDIREVAIWHDLKEIFPDYNNRSRILITTRSVDVAAACPRQLDFVSGEDGEDTFALLVANIASDGEPCTPRLVFMAKDIASSCRGFPHRLEFLSDEDTLALLMAIAFHGEPCPPHLAVTAEKIASSCRGFPHAVVFVGKLLSFANPIEEYWEIVLSSTDKCGSHAVVMEVLMLLTYNHLPQQLKVCLLYMAIFPYTYGISFVELGRLLIAEIFTNGRTIVMESLCELTRRCFFVRHLKFNDIYITRLEIAEEVFHEFLVRKAKEEKFFLVINKDTSYAFVKGDTTYNQQRRLCIQQNIHHFVKDLSKYNSNSSVRSLLYCGPKSQYPLRAWSENFKLLEVFDALKVSFYTFPHEILKSVLLRYLALSYNGQLPATVCNLQDLQILIVSHYLNMKCSGVPSYLPVDIWNLKDLWYLQVMGTDLPEPPSGNDLLLEKLFQLSGVSAHSCTRNILERTRNLYTLGVRIESSPEDESLSFFSHLDILNLRIFKCVVMYPDIGSQVVSFPIPAFPATLKKLTLSGCGFPWEYMRAIASLPVLKILKLKTYAFQGPKWEVKTNEFTKLKSLQLEDTDLEYWTCSTGSSFLELESLCISHCYKLRDIPSIFADSSTLRILEVVDCSKSAMNPALEIQEKILSQGRRSTLFHIYSSEDD